MFVSFAAGLRTTVVFHFCCIMNNLNESKANKRDQMYFYLFFYFFSTDQVSVQTGIPDRRSSQVVYVRIKKASDRDKHECC